MSAFSFKAWPTQHRKITQHFGANPHNYAQFGLPGHEGVDIRAPSGTPIMCVADGVVYRVNLEADKHNYGIHVRVKHAEGYLTTYAHLQEAFVQEDEVITAGAVLGLADNTGNSFGSHLHLTLKKEGAKVGEWPRGIIDPTPFLLPLMGWQLPAGPYLEGWVLSPSISVSGELAQANDDITLRITADDNVLIPAATIMGVIGHSQQGFTKVKVARAAVGLLTVSLPTQPAPLPPNNILMYTGWAQEEQLNIIGRRGIVNTPYGIAIRATSDNQSHVLGLARRGCTVSILGRAENSYLPVKVRRIDLRGPINPPQPLPELPLASVDELPDTVIWGWVAKKHLSRQGFDATISHYGASVRSKPGRLSQYVATAFGDAPARIIGHEDENFVPLIIGHQNLVRITETMPERAQPQLYTAAEIANGPNTHLSPPPQTTPGWVLSVDIDNRNGIAQAPAAGLNLRAEPKRDAKIIGLIPAATPLFITDEAQGEFTPVRVADETLQPAPAEPYITEPSMLGQARLGLHAAADPDISDAEHQEFAELRPAIIKVLSFHSHEDIHRLAQAHPRASWVVRAFLHFGGRRIAPSQFLRDTFPDTERALEALANRDVVIELHNEPNLAPEGLYSSWADASGFNTWWLELLELYQQRLPDQRFIFPGLSPGATVSNLKIDHIQFLEACRPAIQAADGLGVHLYWSNVYPMQRALDVLDDTISRFRNTPIWITEASNNKSGTTVHHKAQQYLDFWHALQTRPIVQGVTYFVASASNPNFAEEVWVGRGLGKLVGQR